jgi:hypothetical protein
MTDHEDMIRRLVEISILLEALYYDATGEVATYLRQAGDKVLIAIGKANIDQRAEVRS